MERVSTEHEKVRSSIKAAQKRKYMPTFFESELESDMIDLPYRLVDNVADLEMILKFSAERVFRLYYLKLVADLNEDIEKLADLNERK